MIVFKNRSGFTLVEVMIAIAIIGMVLTPIFAFQLQIVRRVNSSFDRSRRLIFAQNMLVEMHEQRLIGKDVTTQQKQESGPATKLNYELKTATNHPQLKKLPNLYVERIVITDPTGAIKKEDVLGTIIFKPVQTEQKK